MLFVVRSKGGVAQPRKQETERLELALAIVGISVQKLPYAYMPHPPAN